MNDAPGRIRSDPEAETRGLALDGDQHDKESFAAAKEEVVGHAMYVSIEDGGEAGMATADGACHFRAPLRTLEPTDPARILRRAAQEGVRRSREDRRSHQC